MFIYIFVFLLLLCCVFVFDINGKQKDRSFWERVIVIVLILLAGLRNHVGSDSIKYEYTFYNDILTLKDFFTADWWNDFQEPVWTLLMSIFKTVGGSFVVFQFVHAILLNTLLFRFYKRVTDKTFTALLITFLVSWFGLSFEILRQSLCIAIYLNAVLLLKDKKIIAYILLSILMFGIHNFSVVMSIISPFVLFVNKKWLYPTLFLAALFVILYVDETLLNLLFLATEDFGNDNMQDKINAYTGNSNYGYVNYNINGIIRQASLSVLYPISIILLNRGNHLTNKNNNFSTLQMEDILNGFILLYVVLGLMSSKLLIFFRLQQYLLPFVVVSTVIVIYKKKKKLLLAACFSFFFMIFTIDAVVTLYKPSDLVSSSVSYDTRYFPYTSVFQEEDPLRRRMWGM